MTDANGRSWQYHPRSDQHSKVACWAILFDLLQTSSLLRRHVAEGRVAFGINRQINDWQSGRKKNLDLVVARATSPEQGTGSTFDLTALAERWHIQLDDTDRELLAGLPVSPEGAAGSTVLVALEAKATMTAHIKALPRLHDELTSSHSTVHGDSDNALAIGFSVINHALRFISPSRQSANGVTESIHTQPKDTTRTIAKIREIKRRAGPHSNQAGFDALGVLVIDMANDGSPVTLLDQAPAPAPDDDFYYDRMITRAAHLYDSAFGNV